MDIMLKRAAALTADVWGLATESLPPGFVASLDVLNPVHIAIELTLALFIGYIYLFKRAYDPAKKCVPPARAPLRACACVR